MRLILEVLRYIRRYAKEVSIPSSVIEAAGPQNQCLMKHWCKIPPVLDWVVCSPKWLSPISRQTNGGMVMNVHRNKWILHQVPVLPKIWWRYNKKYNVDVWQPVESHTVIWIFGILCIFMGNPCKRTIGIACLLNESALRNFLWVINFIALRHLTKPTMSVMRRGKCVNRLP